MPEPNGSPAPKPVIRRIAWARLFAVCLLALALAPGLWVRSEAHWPRSAGPSTLRFERLAASTPETWPAELKLVGAWRLTSESHRFGGYSALLADEDGTLTAISDLGRTLRMGRPDRPGAPAPRFGRVRRPNPAYWNEDIESATADPKSGRRWYGYENINEIRRFERGESGDSRGISPPAMRHWSANGGAEAMARLPDGRFVVLAEDAPWLSAGGHAGLLFPSDPVDGAKPLEFTFRPPIGYDPSDMAALPDGRVVILLRIVDPLAPPFFRAMLAVADPADIAAGKDWPWRKLADLAGPVPRDNYEGLAIAPDPDGATLWVISDDNFARLQRTLLLELHWRVPPRGAAER
jgi:hypothetical protein